MTNDDLDNDAMQSLSTVPLQKGDSDLYKMLFPGGEPIMSDEQTEILARHIDMLTQAGTAAEERSKHRASNFSNLHEQHISSIAQLNTHSKFHAIAREAADQQLQSQLQSLQEDNRQIKIAIQKLRSECTNANQIIANSSSTANENANLLRYVVTSFWVLWDFLGKIHNFLSNTSCFSLPALPSCPLMNYQLPVHTASTGSLSTPPVSFPLPVSTGPPSIPQHTQPVNPLPASIRPPFVPRYPP